MNFDIEALADLAHAHMTRIGWSRGADNGEEIGDGFVALFNEKTGQSKIVLYHAESGYVFKWCSWARREDASNSGRHIGHVTLEGDLTYSIRLPRFFYVGEVEVQEYVGGMDCGCDAGGWCDHAKAMVKATNCRDAHQGNWKIVDDEIVLFDFDGIVLD